MSRRPMPPEKQETPLKNKRIKPLPLPLTVMVRQPPKKEPFAPTIKLPVLALALTIRSTPRQAAPPQATTKTGKTRCTKQWKYFARIGGPPTLPKRYAFYGSRWNTEAHKPRLYWRIFIAPAMAWHKVVTKRISC